MTRRSSLWAILVGGSIAGTLDIVFAISFAAYNGVPPTRLLQTVASGLLGKAAYSGGAWTAALGLALHFAIAFLLAGLFLAAARRVPLLSRQALLSGIVFGIGVFLVMRLIVLPLSAFPHPVHFKPLATVLDLLSHMLLFGVPIALAAKQARRSP
ncbi:MAG: hypothetical protein JWQ90_3494 [Hydrocarboniphaga sp.]|uniref:hypothetical protein n=1 Tax=Hydrocarboniphaga sp. TaxID=2033016 RepID=UPI002632C200|nr:hypothetical protein [Hydrocarboniphaga sp.]MDB5971044.1 hypothetical protein [Hydrocarboniphaga sp.]